MTTPEAFRRRQLVEGTILLVLGLWVAFWSFHSSEADKDIIECLETKVQSLSDVSGTRSKLVERESETTQQLLLNINQVKTQQEFDQRLQAYNEGIEQIQQEREESPIPPYPKGSCD
jgi:hypothetical protein